MEKKVITTPIKTEDIKDLRVGDMIYLTGMMATCRDSGHARRVREGVIPEKYEFAGNAIFHAGPIVKKDEKTGKYSMVSVGPTTSMRMEAFEADFIEQTGVKLIIGKGGMGDNTAAACKKFGALHCVLPGGCAVMAAEEVEEVEDVEWLDFGVPEALWICRVKEFGPLIVSIDTEGNNMFTQVKEDFNKAKEEQAAAVKPKVHYMK